MKRKYSFGQQRMTFMLLISLYLQSCTPDQSFVPPPSQPPIGSVPAQEDELVLSEQDFEKIDPIGIGGQGKVFKCKLKKKLDKPYAALKEINLEDGDLEKKKKTKENAERELLSLKKLKHPNIVCLIGYHFSPQKDTLSIVMDLHEMSLEQYLAEQNYNNRWWSIAEGILLPPHDTRNIAKQVLQGLAYMHSQRIAHRDIKPANILINTKINEFNNKIIESILLTDFGSSKDYGTTVTGTRHYMHSIIREAIGVWKKLVIDDSLAKMDIHSFGKVLYVCVTGAEEEKLKEKNLKMPVDITHQEYGIVVDIFNKSNQEELKNIPTCAKLLDTFKVNEKNSNKPELTGQNQGIINLIRKRIKQHPYITVGGSILALGVVGILREFLFLRDGSVESVSSHISKLGLDRSESFIYRLNQIRGTL